MHRSYQCAASLWCVTITLNELEEMKSKEIIQLSDLDLKEMVASEREALQELRFNHSIAGLEKPYQLREKRRDIARILTEITSRANVAKASQEEK